MAATGGSGGAAGGPNGGDLCDAGVWDGSMPEVLSLSGNTSAHDPTMIEANGVFYRFWTGNYIPQATSTDLRNWRNAPPVYGSSYPSWSSEWLNGVPNETFNFPWAPDVSFFNGQYHIYSSFSAIFGGRVSCITHLTTNDIAAGNWTDHGPVICTEGDEEYNAIDADVGLDADGTPWLAFGSFWDGIMAFRLNADGSRAGTDMTRLAWANQIEAPVLFRRCGYYYLFVTWGLCCPGEGRSIDQLTYRVAVGRAQSITGPYVDRDGKPMVDGGGTLLVEGDHVEWAAAGHSDVLVTGSTIYHLYHAYRQANGAAQLRIVELPFDEQGWPVAGGP
jgi:arabinan endo-1,5-alpha-L-arabinosidase